MITAFVTKQLIRELKEDFLPELQLPTLSEFTNGITIQEISYRAGIKKIIDYLEDTAERQKTDTSYKFPI